MRSGFKLVLVTLPLVLAGVGFVAYTIATKPAPEQVEIAERATAVRVIEATRTAVAPMVSGFGLVAPARTYEAIPQVAGTAVYVNPLLKAGGIVPEGAVLLRLSASDFNLAIAQARANIRAAEARLAEITVSEANLKSALDIELETLTLKAKELARVEQLYSAGTASQSARDAAKAAHLAQRQKVQNLQSSLSLLPTQRLVQTEQIAVYQTSLETAELNLARTELRLPYTARVASVLVEVGQFVAAGKPVASFDGIETAEVEAQIPAADLQDLFRADETDTHGFALNPSGMAGILDGLGLEANVRLKLGKTFIVWPATLDRTSSIIDPSSGTVGVIVRVSNPYSSAEMGRRPPLTKGMFVEVTLTTRPVEGIVVPRSALREGQLMVVDGQSRLRLIPVQPYLVQGDIALITEGLSEGTQVIASAPVPVMEGMLLETHPDSGLMRALAAAGMQAGAAPEAETEAGSEAETETEAGPEAETGSGTGAGQ